MTASASKRRPPPTFNVTAWEPTGRSEMESPNQEGRPMAAKPGAPLQNIDNVDAIDESHLSVTPAHVQQYKTAPVPARPASMSLGDCQDGMRNLMAEYGIAFKDQIIPNQPCWQRFHIEGHRP